MKLVRTLAGKARDRRETGLFLVEGARLVEELTQSSYGIDQIYYSEDASTRVTKMLPKLLDAGLRCEMVSATVFKTISETETSQGILAIAKLPKAETPTIVRDDLLLIPDQIRDPGNLGTLLRSAVAAGVGRVLIPPDTVDPFSPKVVRSAMGAHFMLTISLLSWEDISAALQGYNVFVAAADGDTPLWQADLSSRTALIVGGEAEGAGEHSRALANTTLNIPMEGKIESLNAGVAGSIILFEALRQRKLKK